MICDHNTRPRHDPNLEQAPNKVKVTPRIGTCYVDPDTGEYVMPGDFAGEREVRWRPEDCVPVSSDVSSNAMFSQTGNKADSGNIIFTEPATFTAAVKKPGTVNIPLAHGDVPEADRVCPVCGCDSRIFGPAEIVVDATRHQLYLECGRCYHKWVWKEWTDGA